MLKKNNISKTIIRSVGETGSKHFIMRWSIEKNLDNQYTKLLGIKIFHEPL